MDGQSTGRRLSRVKLPLNIALNKKLYKVIRVEHANDTIILWDYEEHKRTVQSYTAVLQLGERVYDPKEVAAMMSRSKYVLKFHAKYLPEPYRAYSMTPARKPMGRFWDADGVMEIRDYMTTVHRGQPRKDGKITTPGVPSRAELRAMLNQEPVHYVKSGDKFVPTWKAH